MGRWPPRIEGLSSNAYQAVKGAAEASTKRSTPARGPCRWPASWPQPGTLTFSLLCADRQRDWDVPRHKLARVITLAVRGGITKAGYSHHDFIVDHLHAQLRCHRPH